MSGTAGGKGVGWAGVSGTPYWLDDPSRPAARPRLTGDTSCDVAVVGGGFTGLWTALLAKEADPDRDVVLLEGNRVGWAASGRNGGFCAASLTHGYDNGLDRFPDEIEVLERLGRDNLRGLCDTVERYGIDCHLERSGELSVATEPYQVAGLQEAADAGRGQFLDAESVRKEVDSPTYLAGLWDRTGTVMVHPAKLAWGLAAAAERLGVRIFEATPVRRQQTAGERVWLTTDSGRVQAGQAVLATNAFPALLRRLSPYTIPVYDYAIVTEPLDADRLGAIGWANRQGVGDSGNQFHYYRLTPDNRVLFGGYDAVYHYGKRMSPRHDRRPATFDLLRDHLFETFPGLGGIGFTHAWGGAIDLCSRFCAFFGTASGGRLAYAAGFTGLGVGATRFAAQVMLDLLAGEETERTATKMVRSKPLPFPPEPLAWLGVQVTRRSLDRADRNEGRRNLWLQALDRLGLGYDS